MIEETTNAGDAVAPPDEEFLDDVEAEAESVDVEAFAPADDHERTVLRYLRLRSNIANEIVRVKDQLAAFLKTQESRIKGLDYVYLGLAEEYARRKLGIDGPVGSPLPPAPTGKKKPPQSVKTPFGKLGFRAVATLLEVVDEDKAIAVLKEAGLTSCFATKTTIVKAALNDHFASTGHVPPGCDVRPAGHKFYVG